MSNVLLLMLLSYKFIYKSQQDFYLIVNKLLVNNFIHIILLITIKLKWKINGKYILILYYNIDLLILFNNLVLYRQKFISLIFTSDLNIIL